MNPLQITIEQAYAEACRALGDANVREQLLTAEIARLQGVVDQLDTSKAAEPAQAPE